MQTGQLSVQLCGVFQTVAGQNNRKERVDEFALHDCLLDQGFQSQAWVLRGLCPDCGGELRRTRQQRRQQRLAHADPTHVCTVTLEPNCTDCDRTEYHIWRDFEGQRLGLPFMPLEFILNRIAREIRLKRCQEKAHFYHPLLPRPSIWNENPACPRCAGSGWALP